MLDGEQIFLYLYFAFVFSTFKTWNWKKNTQKLESRVFIYLDFDIYVMHERDWADTQG